MQAAQLNIDFTTNSPINQRKISGQNKRLYDYLMTGKRIHCYHPAMRELRIGYLNSRTSDLKNNFSIPIESQYIEIDNNGEKTDVKEYWIDIKTYTYG